MSHVYILECQAVTWLQWCSSETQYCSVTQTEGKGTRITYLTVNGVCYMLTPLGNQKRSKNLWQWIGTQHTFCPWKDRWNTSCDRGGGSSRTILLKFGTPNDKFKTLWKRERKATHRQISESHLVQAKPTFSSSDWLCAHFLGLSSTVL